MTMLVAISVGPSGLDYLRERLSRGKTLSQLAARQVGPSWSAFALLPHSVSIERARQFGVGGVGQAALSWRCMGQFIDRLMKTDYACILENALAVPSDPAIRNDRGGHIYHDTEVYHLLTGNRSAANISGLELLKEAATSDLLHGFVVPAKSTHALRDHEAVSRERLEQLAACPELAFVGAYDGEGFVGASKPDSSVAQLLQQVLEIQASL